MKVCAVILAAGSGSRMNNNTKKQFMEIEGKPIIWFALNAFQESDVDEMVLVTSKEDMDFCKSIMKQYNITKTIKVIEGGKERYNSVYNAIKEIECDYVLIHDGARPAIKTKLINKAIEETIKYKACVAGVPVKDTIKVVNANGEVESTPKRSTLYITQTPQSFEYEVIKSAYEKMQEENDSTITDDSMVVEKYSETKVHFIEGDYENIKITTPEDLHIFKAILDKNKK